MTALAEAPARPEQAPAPVRSSYRFELLKLLTLWRVRLVLAACWLGPALLVGVIGQQSSLPSDTVFGRWMSQTGWAGPLVVLSFCGTWVLPLLASLIAGDVLAAEDRFGTWRHLLVAVRSPRRIFAAKTLVAVTVIVAFVVGIAVSAVIGGLISIGNQPLTGLDGHQFAPGSAAGLVVLAWASVLAPTLAFAALGLLGAVLVGRSPMALILPAVFALLLQLAQLLPLPVAVRLALPSYGFTAWRGLFTAPAQLGPLVAGVIVALVWAVVAAALAYRMFLRRDFTAPQDGAEPRVLAPVLVALAAVFAVSVGLIDTTTAASGSGIDARKLEHSLATAYAHLYRRQTDELHRPAVTEQQLQASASCDKGDSLSVAQGAGNDWRCVVTWHLPGSAATGSAIYQLDVAPDGKYVADGDGPQAVNGFFVVHTAFGDQPNPLWQFDGLVDLLTPVSKG